MIESHKYPSTIIQGNDRLLWWLTPVYNIIYITPKTNPNNHADDDDDDEDNGSWLIGDFVNDFLNDWGNWWFGKLIVNFFGMNSWDVGMNVVDWLGDFVMITTGLLKGVL